MVNVAKSKSSLLIYIFSDCRGFQFTTQRSTISNISSEIFNNRPRIISTKVFNDRPRYISTKIFSDRSRSNQTDSYTNYIKEKTRPFTITVYSTSSSTKKSARGIILDLSSIYRKIGEPFTLVQRAL